MAVPSRLPCIQARGGPREASLFRTSSVLIRILLGSGETRSRVGACYSCRRCIFGALEELRRRHGCRAIG